LSEPFKICPICNTPNHRQAVVCITCGTTLGDVSVHAPKGKPQQPSFDYDYRYGETDLFEGNLRRTGRAYLLGGLVTCMVVVCGGLFLLIAPLASRLVSQMRASSIPDAVFTSSPTVFFATVTPAPPTLSPTPAPPPTDTATLSPTPAPCIQKVQPGQGLIEILAICGHRSLDVMQEVLKLNHLTDPSRIQVGQEIIVPWPTATLDPNAVPTATPSEAAAQSGDNAATVANSILSGDNLSPVDPFAPTATSTLQPGVTWHKVQKGEDMISIAVEYGATAEILSQLNPEITFSQCDFGQPSGGGTCVVNLYEGQLIRVPAPTATPTIPPTPSGSETSTPTATATYNAPSALSPTNRAFFLRDQLVTLRWVASGTLADGEAYRVRLTDDQGTVHTADTIELFLIVPTDWQRRDGKTHDYTWTVSVIDSAAPDQLRYTTPPLTFTWQG
jgi:LysM repeat protein